MIYGHGDTMSTSRIQAVYFMKPRWNESRATQWLKEHKYKPIKAAHLRGAEIRYRLLEPNFRRYTTVLLENGVHLVLGWTS